MGLSERERANLLPHLSWYNEVWDWVEIAYDCKIKYATPMVPMQFIAQLSDSSWIYVRSRHGQISAEWMPAGTVRESGEGYDLPLNADDNIYVKMSVEEFPDETALKEQIYDVMSILGEARTIKLR